MSSAIKVKRTIELQIVDEHRGAMVSIFIDRERGPISASGAALGQLAQTTNFDVLELVRAVWDLAREEEGGGR